MTRLGNVAILLAILLLAVAAQAQERKPDTFGAADTVYAEINRIDDLNFSVTISVTNDENLVGLAVPLKLSAGQNKIVADSAVFTGGRVEDWAYRGFRPDTAIQCVTVGMIANLVATDHTLAPGKGRVVTIFISSLEQKKIEELRIDTTTTHPDNSLLAVLDLNQPNLDSVEIDPFDREFVPIWVISKNE